MKRSTELPQPLADAVRTRLSLSGPLTQIEVRERPHTVLRLVESERGRMWIKSYRRIGDDARLEYEFLRFASSALRDTSALAVPDPLAYLEPATVVLSDVVGRPLRPSLSKRAARRCGEWLAAIHTAGEDARQTFDMGLAAAFVAERWDGLQERVDELAAESTPWDRASVITHGDFAPHNVFVGRESVTVLDPSFHVEFGRRGARCSRHEDVARFWISLRGTPAPSRPDLAEAFLEAYANGRDIRTPGFKLFAVLQMGIALRDWSGLPQPLQTGLLAQLLSELERSG